MEAEMMGLLLAALVAATEPCGAPMARDRDRAVVTVEMEGDGSLIVSTVDPRVPNFPVERIARGGPNYYATIKMVGGIEPGQRKTMPEFTGRVDMAADGTLTHTYWGSAKNGAQLNNVETAHPGDAKYREILSLVGELKPGEWKMVRACENGEVPPQAN